MIGKSSSRKRSTRNPFHLIKRKLIAASVLLAIPVSALLPDSAWAEGFEIKVSKEATHEQFERDVDEAALSAQEKAISRIGVLLHKYRGTAQEPILLGKLADLHQQNAAILFRIAHGAANRRNKAIDLSRYNKAMKSSITTLNTLIAKYPRYEEIAHAYFMRGKAFEEIQNVPARDDWTTSI